MTKDISAPQNAKSLLSFIFKTMEGVAKGEIDNKTANALTGLAAQANNTIKNELCRTALQLKMLENPMVNINPSEVRIRNLEIKGFSECGRDYNEIEK